MNPYSMLSLNLRLRLKWLAVVCAWHFPLALSVLVLGKLHRNGFQIDALLECRSLHKGQQLVGWLLPRTKSIQNASEWGPDTDDTRNVQKLKAKYDGKGVELPNCQMAKWHFHSQVAGIKCSPTCSCMQMISPNSFHVDKYYKGATIASLYLLSDSTLESCVFHNLNFSSFFFFRQLTWQRVRGAHELPEQTIRRS